MHCFIQARMSSTRLPGKVLKSIGKKKILEILILRLRKSKKIRKLVILTSSHPSDEKIIKFCQNNNIDYFCGPLENVYLRFQKAIKHFKCNAFVRINADSPLMDWKLVDQMIEIFNNNKFDIVTNVLQRFYPKGQSVEILNSKLFRKKSSTLKKIEREHVTKFYYNNHSKYKIYNKTFPKNLSKINLSVDTNLDLRNIKRKIKVQGCQKNWKNYI